MLHPAMELMGSWALRKTGRGDCLLSFFSGFKSNLRGKPAETRLHTKSNKHIVGGFFSCDDKNSLCYFQGQWTQDEILLQLETQPYWPHDQA